MFIYLNCQKNNVFRLDFPECTVKYGAKIPRFKLPSEIAVGICLKIFISEVSPLLKYAPAVTAAAYNFFPFLRFTVRLSSGFTSIKKITSWTS